MFVEGRSAVAELNAVIEHLQGCARCRLTVEDIAEAEQEELSDAEAVRKETQDRKAFRWWLPLAAAIVIALSIIPIIRRSVPARRITPMQTLIAASPTGWRPTAGRLTGGFRWAPVR
ncbi:MAG TPA: hypothetical protein VMU84_06360, partial [Thermoanaerobaculia bacterium]|nr:hypothetical protein [Thermoanaerobaculia bacterium]